MRTFIAIELPQKIIGTLSALQNQLKNTQADVKWVAPENIHLTLKFLGEVDEKKIEKIIQALEETAKDSQPFSIRLCALGAFPKINFPRVIWVGIDAGDEETKNIAFVLEEKLQKLGIPKEKRPFSSHITIGRVRSGINREKLVKELDILQGKGLLQENLEFLATKITLFKSTLTPKGPIYEILKEASFQIKS